MTTPSAMQPTSSASSADLGALNKMPEHLLAIGRKWADYAQADGDNNDIAFAVLSAIQEASAIVPPVVQAPTYDPTLLQSLPSEVIEAERTISAFFNRNSDTHWALGGIQKRVAAPIVATVPSEPVAWMVESCGEIAFHKQRLPFAANWTPLYAAHSPTEQASDVRNAALEEAAVICDQIADELQGEFDNDAEDCGKAIRLRKSATPADKGIAPVEAKL